MSCNVDEYKEIIQTHYPEYLILGNDQYPTNATGIAFCKESWKDMKNKTMSGYHMLNALGINIEKAEEKYPKNASDLFRFMLENRLVFWNASKIDDLKSLGLPKKSIKSIICGPEAEKCLRDSEFLELCKDFPFYVPRHPCPQGANKNNSQDIWNIFWGKKSELVKQLTSIYTNANDLINIVTDINSTLEKL